MGNNNMVKAQETRNFVANEDKISLPLTRRMKQAIEVSNATTKGRKRTLENPIEIEPKKTKYAHEYYYDEDEKYEYSPHQEKSIAEIFSAVTPETKISTDALLRQILARLELLRQQHKQTERQIQYIIDESSSNPDMFIIQQAKLSQTETENNANMSSELLLNLRAITQLLKQQEN